MIDDEPIESAGGDDEEERALVDAELGELREFAESLNIDEIRSGAWFAKLVGRALRTYASEVDWRYFQQRYEGVPVDVMVDQQIKLATRYAAISGALTASAYTGTVAATIGSVGAASPLTVPAAVTTFVADLTYVTRLQLRLAYDMSVLYGIPIDPDDPEDMWKLIRVALTIKGGELTRSGASRVVPALVRPLVKKYFSGATRVAAQSLPVVGRHLLVRNVIKVGIPVVGVPLSTVLNRYTTLVAGRHAQDVFRNEARIIEMVERFCDRTGNPSLTMWIAWYAVLADGRTSDDEALLLRHLARVIKERHGFVDEELARVIDLDVLDLWERIDAEEGDLTDYVAMATRVAEVDGELTDSEAEAIEMLRQRCEADGRTTSIQKDDDDQTDRGRARSR